VLEFAHVHERHLWLVDQPVDHLVPMGAGADAFGTEEQAHAELVAQHDAQAARLGMHAGEEAAAQAPARGAAQMDHQEQAVGVAAGFDERVLGVHGMALRRGGVSSALPGRQPLSRGR
jgi:hypothetical protein